MKSLFTLCLATAYLTRALLFEERVSHYGPWPSRRANVTRMRKMENGQILTYSQPVTSFDRIRQAMTRCYEIDKENNTWYIREDRMEMWTCPKCLTFWMAGLITIPYLLLTGQWKQIPVAWAAVSGGAYLIYHLSEIQPSINVNSFYDAPITDALDGDEDEAL